MEEDIEQKNEIVNKQTIVSVFKNANDQKNGSTN